MKKHHTTRAPHSSVSKTPNAAIGSRRVVTTSNACVEPITTKRALIPYLFNALDNTEPKIPIVGISTAIKDELIYEFVNKCFLETPAPYNPEVDTMISWNFTEADAIDPIGIHLFEFLTMIGESIANRVLPNRIPRSTLIEMMYLADHTRGSGLLYVSEGKKVYMRSSPAITKRNGFDICVPMPRIVTRG